MRTRTTAICLLLLGTLGPVLAAQDKELTLMSAYSTLSPRVERGKTALGKGQLDTCEKEARYCLDRLPEHEGAHFLMAQVLYKKSDFAAALDEIRAAETGYIAMARAVSVLDQQKLKNRSEAMDTLTKDLGDLAAADATVKGRGSCTPDRFTQALEESKNELAREQEERTRSDANRDLREVPAAYRYLHGNILFRLGRTSEAEGEYRAAVEKDPDFGETYNNLVNLLYRDGRIDDARAALAQADAHKARVHPELRKAVEAR